MKKMIALLLAVMMAGVMGAAMAEEEPWVKIAVEDHSVTVTWGGFSFPAEVWMDSINTGHGAVSGTYVAELEDGTHAVKAVNPIDPSDMAAAVFIIGEPVVVNIPDGVDAIGNGAFLNCTGMMSVSIPESVTSIGDEAFAGCADLISAAIPASVTAIGQNAFAGCNAGLVLTVARGSYAEQYAKANNIACAYAE